MELSIFYYLLNGCISSDPRLLLFGFIRWLGAHVRYYDMFPKTFVTHLPPTPSIDWWVDFIYLNLLILDQLSCSSLLPLIFISSSFFGGRSTPSFYCPPPVLQCMAKVQGFEFIALHGVFKITTLWIFKAWQGLQNHRSGLSKHQPRFQPEVGRPGTYEFDKG